MQDVPVLAATLRAILASGVRERVARYRLPRRRKVHVKSKKPKAVRKPVLLFPAAAAMRRAALRAREVARRFGTPIYVSRNGKFVALDP